MNTTISNLNNKINNLKQVTVKEIKGSGGATCTANQYFTLEIYAPGGG